MRDRKPSDIKASKSPVAIIMIAITLVIGCLIAVASCHMRKEAVTAATTADILPTAASPSDTNVETVTAPATASADPGDLGQVVTELLSSGSWIDDSGSYSLSLSGGEVTDACTTEDKLTITYQAEVVNACISQEASESDTVIDFQLTDGKDSIDCEMHILNPEAGGHILLTSDGLQCANPYTLVTDEDITDVIAETEQATTSSQEEGIS